MVLESLIPVKTAERKPIEVLPIAFLYSTLAIFIALWIFPNHASLTVVFFTVMATLPLMIQLIRFEEKSIFNKEIQHFEYHHKKALPFFIFLFLGLVLSFSFWFIVFPQPMVNSLFNVQLNTILQINQHVSGHFYGQYFIAIILNNLKVMAFVILFSFIYGAGAIFILTWNASVVAVAIGNSARNLLVSYANTAGLPGVAAYFSAFSLGILRYLVHGIPEILSYFVAGLAGGLISVAMIRHEFMDEKFKKVLYDSVNLLLLAIGILLVAAVIEVFISPFIPA